MAITENKGSSVGVILIIALIAIIGVVAVAVLRPQAPITVQTGPQSPERNLLSVSGTHEMQVAPDEAALTLEVVTRAPQASQASDTNRNLMNSVMAALRAQGVKDSEIETTGVSLYKVTEWDQREMRSVDKGYEQRTTVRVTTQSLDKVGSILDAAINAGANSVQDVSFQLTPASQARYKEEALKQAAAAAKNKAEVLASASGASLGRITSLSEQSYNYIPYYANTRSVMAMDKAEAAPTPISPEKVSISVTVNIGYELQ